MEGIRNFMVKSGKTADGTGRRGTLTQKIYSLKAFSSIPADFFHEKFLACLRPFSRRVFVRSGSLATFSMAFAISVGDLGSMSKALSPTTSGRDDVNDVMTGQPDCMASNGGIPKPS